MSGRARGGTNSHLTVASPDSIGTWLCVFNVLKCLCPIWTLGFHVSPEMITRFKHFLSVSRPLSQSLSFLTEK